MNTMKRKPYLIYVVDDDEDTQLRLWRAFSMTQPDCLLYEFTTGEEMLEHLSDTQDCPHMILVNALTPATSHRGTMPQLLAEARLRSTPVVMLGGVIPETKGNWGTQTGADVCMGLPCTHQEAVQAVERLRPVWTRPSHKPIDTRSMPYS
jgi:CheY-like chemotaxis protein